MGEPDHLTDSLQAAVARLKEGGLVAFPTETVYGLGADALNPAAVRRVFLAKGRTPRNPLIVHVSGPEAAAPLVNGPLPASAVRLMRAFWPGPLSIVLEKSRAVPDEVTGGGPTVALRCPDHPLAAALLFAFGGPLVGPSANKSGGVSPTTAQHVLAEFDSKTAMVLDGGPGSCNIGIESTVVRLHDTADGGGGADASGATILRPGVIGSEQLEAVLGFTVGVGPGVALADAPLISPGTLESHYAPAAPTILFDDWAELHAYVEEAQQVTAARPAGPVAVLSHSLMADQSDMPPGATLFHLPPDAPGYAAALYATLRDADRPGTRLIAVHRPPLPQNADPSVRPAWRAVHDRLTRASAQRSL